MVPKLDLLMKALVLLSPQMGLNLFHGENRLLQFRTLSLEQPLPNSRFPVMTVFAAATFP